MSSSSGSYELLEKGKEGVWKVWGMTTRRMRAVGAILLFTFTLLALWRPDQRYDAPRITLEYAKVQNDSPYDVTKVALLIENRPLPLLVPLMLHMMSVVPPDWRFRFMGSVESVHYVNQSYALRNQVQIGKLDLTYIPTNMSVAGQEMISRFLTNRWIYETVLAPAEHLLVYQTDSILCANSRKTLNDYLEYDWVGAPWGTGSKYGGNGGLSLRRVSAIIDILKHQERVFDTQPEDVWLTERLGNRPGAHTANGTISLQFSGENLPGKEEKVEAPKAPAGKSPVDKSGKMAPEDPNKPAEKPPTLDPQKDWVPGIDDWRNGQYEPMGYHTGGGGKHTPGSIYGTPEKREHIWKYCPELKMTLKMDAAEYVPGSCNQNWKRGVDGGEVAYGKMMERGLELELDERGYPVALDHLVPWGV